MWKLKNSRGSFLEKYDLRHDRSIWWHVEEQLLDAAPDDFAREELLRLREDLEQKELARWVPTNSNCPAIGALLDRLITLLPQEWKALGRNIFVGIAPLGEVNAEAWNHHVRGVVELNLQYLWVLDEYAAAFDEFRHSMALQISGGSNSRLTRHQDPDYGRLLASWQHLQAAAAEWRDPSLVHPGHEVLGRLAPGRRRTERDRVVSASETFIVAHELAHHLMAHTSRGAKRRARQAREILGGVVAHRHDEEWESLPSSWRQELEADVVGLALIARRFGREGTLGDGYAALLGATVALLATTHINGNWADDGPRGSHPPFMLRLAHLLSAADLWYRDTPRGPHGDHPLDLCVQLEMFVRVAWLCSKQPEFVEASGEGVLESLVADELQQRLDHLVRRIPYPEDMSPLILPEQRGDAAR